MLMLLILLLALSEVDRDGRLLELSSEVCVGRRLPEDPLKGPGLRLTVE